MRKHKSGVAGTLNETNIIDKICKMQRGTKVDFKQDPVMGTTEPQIPNTEQKIQQFHWNDGSIANMRFKMVAVNDKANYIRIF